MKDRPPIDRDSFEPPYAQLARTIRERIAGGAYRPGDRLPSEAELCAAFSVSPMTVRRAIGELVRADVVVTEHGRGTFVKPPQLAAASFDLGDLMRYLASPDVEARILEARIVSAGPRVAEKLAREEGERVISIKRLLLRGDEPVFYHSEYLVFDPARPLVEAELATTALQDLFSGAHGSDLKFGRLTLHASAFTETEASQLGEQPGTLAWVLEHLFFDFDDRPESWGRFVGRADRLSFTTTVGIPGPQEGV
ncbi:MAG: GntR family transcriptional regulator [Actinobacteria bacterium]|nr:GntR family transcriptional regulator [Actinomycetota bacterium]